MSNPCLANYNYVVKNMTYPLFFIIILHYKILLLGSPISTSNNFYFGVFRWVDGTLGDFMGNSLPYQDWYPSEPAVGAGKAAVLTQLTTSDLHWSTVDYTVEARYICEVSDECTALLLATPDFI
jgi:hypothetical protein